MKRIDYLKTLDSDAMAAEIFKCIAAIKDAERNAPPPASGSSLYETSKERAEGIKRTAVEIWLNEEV